MRDRERLERALGDLAERVVYPETPDLASRVRARIEAEPVRRHGWWNARWNARVRVAVAAVLLAALVIGVLPGSRAAVARLWDLVGVSISRDALPSTIEPAPPPRRAEVPGANLSLGREVGLDEASALIGGKVLVPSLGAPDAAWYQEGAGSRVVTLVYRGRAGLPVSPYTRQGLILGVLTGAVPDPGALVKKVPGEGTQVEVFDQGGQTWYWLAGEAHALYTGVLGPQDGRLAGNTLLWRSGGRTYRLEAQISRDEAVRIARSLR
jgi:hypothetical protein